MLINISIHADNPADYRDALKALNEGAGLAELDLGEILPEVKVTPVVTKAAPTKQATPTKQAAPVQAPHRGTAHPSPQSSQSPATGRCARPGLGSRRQHPGGDRTQAGDPERTAGIGPQGGPGRAPGCAGKGSGQIWSLEPFQRPRSEPRRRAGRFGGSK